LDRPQSTTYNKHKYTLVEHFKFFSENIGEKHVLFFTLFFSEKFKYFSSTFLTQNQTENFERKFMTSPESVVPIIHTHFQLKMLVKNAKGYSPEFSLGK
jgi:hypothetical protein